MISENSHKVSIVLPTFNGARYIQESIASCLNQTFKNFELIVIDDGSTDNTLEKVKFFKDDRLKFIGLPTNQGHIAALNKGFSLATGDLLTWTSDDNYYARNALGEMVDVLDTNKGVDFVYTKYQVIDSEGEPLRIGRFEDPDYLDVDNCIGGCFLYRRKVYETIGDFNPEAFLAEDYEYWLRVRQKFHMKKLDKVLYFYRVHEKSLTGLHREEKVQEQVQKIRDKFVPKWKRLLMKIISRKFAIRVRSC
ncbi:MAG: glycosyltransferase, partial [Candidatus Omnitrophica bacterium]|nr:glycosyltransferase [Candidatus Omnitrophota bacterium]